MNVKKVLLPHKPQLDPIAALYLLGHYGEEKYPGVGQAPVIYWERSDDPTPAEMADLTASGVLALDIGGGPFDHHNVLKNGRGETVTSLVAAALGIESNPELSSLLGYIREDELEGIHNRYGDLVHLVKSLYKQGTPSNRVVESAMRILDVLQKGQKIWHVDVKRELEDKAREFRVKRHARRLKVVVIESDNLQVGNYALTVKNASVVIQRRSTGHVMIQTNKHHNIDLREIVGAIRKRELEMRVYQKPIDVRKLRFEGKSMLVPNWFYHRSLNAFLNGSDALGKTEPTEVPFEEIVRFVIYGLSTEESELCDCGRGNAACPYYAYGFSRCEIKRGGGGEERGGGATNNDF